MSTDGASSPLRFVTRGWRRVDGRPAATRRAIGARLRHSNAYLAWSDADTPRQIVPTARPDVARWVRRTFEPWARRKLDAATWSALRAGSLVVGEGPGLAQLGAEEALGRSLDGAVLGCVSASGHVQAKLLCFVFERGEREPSVVVKGIPLEGEGSRLLAEASAVAAIRKLLSGATAAALPPEPVWAGDVGGHDVVVVEPVDPLAGATGHEDRDAALGWLARLQDETAHDEWGTDADLASLDEVLEFASSESGLGAGALRTMWREQWDDLGRTTIPRCAVHGDFWRGNLAVDGLRLRVYDWEWAALSGHPLFDPWTYELAALRGRAESPHEVAAALADACRRVEAQLEGRGLDRRLARAFLLPAAADIAYRVRRVRGTPPDHEERARALLAGAARLVSGG
ncbi:MAG: phosphotransferase [Thermoleophilaceae bacterium]